MGFIHYIILLIYPGDAIGALFGHLMPKAPQEYPGIRFHALHNITYSLVGIHSLSPNRLCQRRNRRFIGLPDAPTPSLDCLDIRDLFPVAWTVAGASFGYLTPETLPGIR